MEREVRCEIESRKLQARGCCVNDWKEDWCLRMVGCGCVVGWGVDLGGLSVARLFSKLEETDAPSR